MHIFDKKFIIFYKYLNVAEFYFKYNKILAIRKVISV